MHRMWGPADDEQVQSLQVFVHRFTVNDTVEDRILALQEQASLPVTCALVLCLVSLNASTTQLRFAETSHCCCRIWGAGRGRSRCCAAVKAQRRRPSVSVSHWRRGCWRQQRGGGGRGSATAASVRAAPQNRR